MQTVQLFFLLYKFSEDAFENAHWQKVKQMQSVWLCILSGNQFEEPYENTQGLATKCKAKTIGRGSTNEKPPFLLLPNQTKLAVPCDMKCIWDVYIWIFHNEKAILGDQCAPE